MSNPSESAEPMRTRRGSVWFLRVLVAGGLVSLLFYVSWWLRPGTWSHPVLAAPLALCVLYVCLNHGGNWLIYLAAKRRPQPASAPPGLTVDVFVTACREPYEMVETVLRAACAMRGAHETYLLDDGDDPALKSLAAELGAGYITRTDRRDAKAGNMNAALPKTSGDVIAIFDVDHVPAPDFLERAVGHFADPSVGFVQVMVTFWNGGQSWIAQAAAETSLDFYNATSLGMDNLGAVSLMGSNAVIRRAALESIGGYQPGLAEDLATSFALHKAGWRSAYVAEPLAPGEAPSSVASWFTQQMKWARGVFEVFLTEYLPALPRLSFAQRQCYFIRMTNYWIGPATLIHLCATVYALMHPDPSVRALYGQYLIHLMPVVVSIVAIRNAAMSAWGHSSVATTSLWRATSLVLFTWPVYTMAWMMALLRLPLGFRPTPKGSGGQLPLTWILPQICSILLLGWGIQRCWSQGESVSTDPLLIGVAAAQAIPLILVLAMRFRRNRLAELYPRNEGDGAAMGTLVRKERLRHEVD